MLIIIIIMKKKKVEQERVELEKKNFIGIYTNGNYDTKIIQDKHEKRVCSENKVK